MTVNVNDRVLKDTDLSSAFFLFIWWTILTFTLTLYDIFVCLFVCFDSLHPSQQFFSHVGSGLRGFNYY